ncbi:MAG: glycosyltransferase [Myxococcota bacterium]
MSWWPAVLPCLALVIGVFNLSSWPSGRRRSARRSGVSVAIPARDEERNIGAAVDAALATGADEVWVLDDESTDGTMAILQAKMIEEPRLRVLRGEPLPPGWVGKVWACHRLAEAARSPWILFVDADVQLEPDALERMFGLVEAHRADVLTALPAQILGGWFERAVVPLLHLTYVSWLPLLLVPWTRSTRFLAANGQIMFVRTEAYRAMGGFASVRDAIVDDMAFCARAKQSGRRVLFADGRRLARCRMYRSPREVWEGFSKNLYVGVGAKPHRLALVLGLYVGAFALPFFAFGSAELAPAAALGSAAVVLLRLGIALRFRQGLDTVLLHPVGIVAFVAIGLNSLRWSLRRQIAWRGRVYSGVRESTL